MCSCRICESVPADLGEARALIDHVRTFEFAKHPAVFIKFARTLQAVCDGPDADDILPLLVADLLRIAAPMLLDRGSRATGIDILDIVNESLVGHDLHNYYTYFGHQCSLIEVNEMLCEAAHRIWEKFDDPDGRWGIVWMVAKLAAFLEYCPLAFRMHDEVWIERLVDMYRYQRDQESRAQLGTYLVDLLHCLRNADEEDVEFNQPFYDSALELLKSV